MNIYHSLTSLAEKCERSVRVRIVFFAILTVATLLLYGYYFGTFDQASHIPFLKKFANPSLFPQDPYIDLRLVHFSFFWILFIPLLKAGILEISMFTVYVGVLFLTFYSVWNLTRTLFGRPLTSLLATLAVLFPHFGFSGFTIFEFSLLNRTFVLPFELIAINWYLQKKYLRVFFALGLLYNLHAISVHFILAMMGLDLLVRIRQVGVMQLVKMGTAFLVGAMPVLYWKFSTSGIHASANWEWFEILDKSTFFHLFHFISIDKPYVTLLTLGGVATVVLFYVLKKFALKAGKVPELHKTITHFFIAGVLVLLLQLFATHVYPVGIIIQSQITRVGLFLTFFSYLYAADFIATHSIHWKPLFRMLFLLGLLFSLSPVLLMVVYGGYVLYQKYAHVKPGIKNILESTVVTYVVTILLVFASVCIFLFAVSYGIYRPAIHIFAPHNAYTEAQLWAKEHTPLDAVFIVPPYTWGIYDVEWRVLSERTAVTSLSEILEAAFEPGYIPYWKERFEDVAPGVIETFNGNFFESRDATRKAHFLLTEEDIERIAKKYGASYAVIEKPRNYALPIVYENEQYLIYQIK